MFLLFRIPIRELRFSPFGVSITPRFPALIPEIQILLSAAAGPAMNLLTLLILSLFTNPFSGADSLLLFSAANLYLGLLNLLPIPPLDGGRILKACLTLSLGEDRGERISLVVGLIFSLALLGGGLYLVIDSGMDLSVCAVGGYTFLLLSYRLWKQRKRKRNESETGTDPLSGAEAGALHRR